MVNAKRTKALILGVRHMAITPHAADLDVTGTLLSPAS